MIVLATDRLRLVPLDECHLDGLNALNSDPEVMRYISGRAETRAETLDFIERVKHCWIEFGYSWWAFIDRSNGEIIGAGCLQHLRREATQWPDPACPLEIGWRLRRALWGRGLATEAARAIARFAFGNLQASELLAVCDPDNTASSNVMQRIGMRYRGLEQWHGGRLATYRLARGRWLDSLASPLGGRS